jgi:hypothetical protein
VSARAPGRLPARLDFGADDGRAPSWGRLEALSPGGARLLTLARLERGQTVLLSFELAGEDFRELPARVVASEADADGFCAAELDITAPRERRRLARILLDVLSR